MNRSVLSLSPRLTTTGRCHGAVRKRVRRSRTSEYDVIITIINVVIISINVIRHPHSLFVRHLHCVL